MITMASKNAAHDTGTRSAMAGQTYEPGAPRRLPLSAIQLYIDVMRDLTQAGAKFARSRMRDVDCGGRVSSVA